MTKIVCPGCGASDWEALDYAAWSCRNCQYLIDPYAYGYRDPPPRPLTEKDRAFLRAFWMWFWIMLALCLLVALIRALAA